MHLLLHCHIHDCCLKFAHVALQFSFGDMLTLKANTEMEVFVSNSSQCAVTEGCEQELNLSHLQARIWKDTLYEHRFFETILVHGESTRFDANDQSCTYIALMIRVIPAVSLTHILTLTLVFTSVSASTIFYQARVLCPA